eukprot:466981-Rhodomonas_salina.4
MCQFMQSDAVGLKRRVPVHETGCRALFRQDEIPCQVTISLPAYTRPTRCPVLILPMPVPDRRMEVFSARLSYACAIQCPVLTKLCATRDAAYDRF